MAEGVEAFPDELLAVVHGLQAKADNFGGVVVDAPLGDVGGAVSLSADDVAAFALSLHLALQLWTLQKKKGVWLKLPTEYSLFVHPAIQEGFRYHHAEPTYVMLVRWLSDEPSTLPANASHHVAIAAFVLNDHHEILAVQEKYGLFKGKWKMPTGRVHQGEDIFKGAIREVKEETGIDTEFVQVIGFRQSHTGAFDKSDVLLLCVLRPLTFTITVQTAELTDAQWIPLSDYEAQEYLGERKMMKKMLDACIETTSVPEARTGFRLDNVQAGTQRAPQYFYHNSGT